MHAAARQLDEEQHVEAPQGKRVDGQEVALKDPRRLLAQEIGPVHLEPLWCRLDAFFLKDPPDGARRQLDPNPTSSRSIRR